jgi:iron complex transport system permease protein
VATSVSQTTLKTSARLSVPRLGLRLTVLALLVGLLVAVFFAALAVGSVSIPLNEIVTVLLGGEASRDAWTNIILKFRLPKALTAMLAGAALSVGGLLMQTLFRNPLADPFVLGIHSGASLGVALVVLAAGTVGGALIAGFGLAGDLGVVIAASLGAAAVMLIVLAVARQVRSSVTLLMMGLMFGYLSSAIVSLLLYTSLPERIQTFVSWSFGSFSGVTWGQMPVFAPVILIGLVLSLLLSKTLNALLLGEAYARSMGVNVRRARILIVMCTSLLAGAVTAFCGPISFIGIAVPHVCRGLFRTADHRALLPAALLVGATASLMASIVAELPGSSLVLPLNAITALVGAPIVLWMIFRQREALSV